MFSTVNEQNSHADLHKVTAAPSISPRRRPVPGTCTFTCNVARKAKSIECTLSNPKPNEEES